MKKREIVRILAGVYGAGALSMYFLDPHRGRRRRAELRDSWIHSIREIEKFTGRFGRDLANRTSGVMAEAQHFFRHEPPTDYVLEQRVHTALGGVVSNPRSVEVSAKAGSVFLSGWIMAEEADDVDKAVASVEGVKDFTSYLHMTERPEHIPALQGGGPRGDLPEFLHQQWSPTSRVLAGCAGLGLALYGTRRWGSIKNFATAAGAVLLARSVLNRPWAAVAGRTRQWESASRKQFSLRRTRPNSTDSGTIQKTIPRPSHMSETLPVWKTTSISGSFWDWLEHLSSGRDLSCAESRRSSLNGEACQDRLWKIMASYVWTRGRMAKHAYRYR